MRNVGELCWKGFVVENSSSRCEQKMCDEGQEEKIRARRRILYYGISVLIGVSRHLFNRVKQ